MVLLLGVSTSQSLFADDVEIYLYEPPDPVPPNVLFVLDESGSMRTQDAPSNGGYISRRDALVDAMTDIFGQSSMSNVMAAFMGYTTRWGNNSALLFRAHSGDFKLVDGNETSFQNQIDALQALNYTPTVKALEQAVAWFRRDQTFVDFNSNSMTSPIAGDPEDNWCKPNHIVLLSDGQPNSNSPTQGQAYGLTSYEGTNCARNSLSVYQNGRCAKEIANWAYTTDLETGTGWNDQQNIVTHTIGFSTNNSTENFLRSIATNGGGNFYPASSAADLVTAFETILTEAQQSIPYTYTAPVIPFNQDNAAISGSSIYVPMLVPSASRFWKGNLKSYTVSTQTQDGELVVVLEDANGQPIVDNSYEFTSSQDHWSSGNDGGNPLNNGAAAHMGESNAIRRLYTNIDSGVALSGSVNRVSTTNANLTNGMFNVATDDDRVDLINWVTWNWTAPPPVGDEDPEPTHEGVMGAPIHTKPAVVDYGADEVIYLPTSEGVLEAIDAETGVELWAFMPTDLLPGISTIKTNNDSTIPYYGLDGPLTVYESGSRKMAIFGMRRGGKSYYLLDITNRLNPEFVAQITDPDPTTAGDDFDGLGQTWSKALPAKMMVGGTQTDVLVFGGGYDTDQDNATARVDDDEGNVIFIINAQDGSLIQRISNATTGVTDMNNAIAADVLPFDMNRNGVMDRLYAADVGGRIIRIDIPEQVTGSLTGGAIADINMLNNTVSTSDFRRFFNTPEIGYYNRNGVQHLAVLIGTGNRPSPLDDTVTDRFYMIKDPNVWFPPISGTYITVNESNLYDASDNLIQDGNSSEQVTAQGSLASSSGWYIDFRTSEKSFSEAVLYNYAVLFTTFSAQRDGDLATCEARGATGVSRFYALNMIDGSAMFSELGGNENTLSSQDRSKVLNMIGMPPTPTLMFPEGENNTLGSVVKALVGLEEVAEWPMQLIPIWWEEVFND
jgi:type IV pilus assembly protein PilY1